MHSLKFLMDADMPRSSAQVIRNPGAIILRLPYTFTAIEINRRLEEFFKSVREDDIRETITIVELSRYRRRSLRND